MEEIKNSQEDEKDELDLPRKEGNKHWKVSVPSISSATLTLEQRLFLAPISKEKLESLRLRECDGYFISKGCIPYKDESKNIYFFEKAEDKDEYQLRLYVSLHKK